MSNGVRYTPTFALPSEYEQAAAEARRRRRMAEMLAQQAYQPQDVGVAPIPKAAPLVQGLQAFLSERQARKAEEAEEKARKADVQSVSDLLKQLSPQERSGAEAAIAEMAQTAQPGRINADGTYTPSTITPGTAEIGMPYTEAAPTGQARQDILMQTAAGGSPRAAQLAQFLMAQTPEAEEFYAPVATEGGKFVQFGKRGGAKESQYIAPQEIGAVTPTTIVRNGVEIVIDARTGREIGSAPKRGPLVANYGAPVAGVDEEGNPIFFQPGKTGGQPSIIEGIRPAPKGMNVDQSKAAGFADRIFEANPVFEQGAIPFEAAMVSQLPLGMGNYALTPQQQSFLQAERNFINAVLRRESGAVISDEEFKNARQQYIPQPGDSPQVLAQKKRNRETVLNSLSRDAGPSYRLPASSMQGSGFGETGGWGQAEVVK